MALIDKEKLDSVIQGDDALLAELAIMFAHAMPDTQSRIRVAIADRDADALDQTAHQLKSRLGYLGATRLQTIAHELESLGRRNELSEAAEPCENLLGGCRELLDELNQLTGLSLSLDDDR